MSLSDWIFLTSFNRPISLQKFHSIHLYPLLISHIVTKISHLSGDYQKCICMHTYNLCWADLVFLLQSYFITGLSNNVGHKRTWKNTDKASFRILNENKLMTRKGLCMFYFFKILTANSTKPNKLKHHLETNLSMLLDLQSFLKQNSSGMERNKLF